MSPRLLQKIAAIFTLVTFIATNSIYAAPQSKSIFKNKKVNYQKISDKNEGVIQQKKAVLTGGDAKEAEAQKKEEQKILSTHLSDISLIHIPQELGKVVEVYQNPDHDNSRLIVHIQDLHTNPEATLNLASILEILVKDYNLGLVCSEGADGEVDTSSVSSFPDPEVRKKVARLFVDSGELTGEEYLSITKYPDLPIWGIENKDIYFKNIEEFNNIMKFNPDSQVFISQAKKALEELKPKIYSKELLAIDQKEADYESQKIETADHLKYLSSYIQKLNIPTANYKNIAILNETIDKESKIDQQKIMQESQNLLLNLQSAIAAKSNRSDMDTLMAKASLFKDQKISPFSFYSYLKDLADKHLKDQVSKYPNLMDFVDYLTKVNSLESVKLFVEMEDLSYEIKQKLAKNDEEKTLIQALRNIKFLEGFFNLKISNEELDYYLQNKDSCKVAFFEAFLKPAIKKYNISGFVDFNPDLIDSHLQYIEDFYKTVKARDLAMFTNATSEVEKRNVKVATLITGGFHTQGITKLLKEKGYSYIVISPFSKTEIDEENYHFLLSGKRKPIDDLIKQLDQPEVANNPAANLRVPLAFDKGLSGPRLEEVIRETNGKSSNSQIFVEEIFASIEVLLPIRDNSNSIKNYLGKLKDLVEKDESAIVFVAGKVLGMATEKIEYLQSLLPELYPSENTYAASLIKGVIGYPAEWKEFIDSVGGDLIKGAGILRRNAYIFSEADRGTPGYATTIINGVDLIETPPESRISITQMDEDSRRKAMAQRKRLNHFTPEQPTRPIELELLGGAGSRYQKGRKENPALGSMLAQQVGENGRFIPDFKCALPTGNTSQTILETKLGKNGLAGDTLVILTAQDNVDEANALARAIMQGAIKRGETAAIISFIQPVTPRRIPTKKALEAFFEKEPDQRPGTPQALEAVLAYCDKHAGEIVLDEKGKPIFGPENHWDFVKYFMQEGLFLSLFEKAMVDGELRDVIVRPSNQDDTGSSLGKDRPVQIAVNTLIDKLQEKNGLYEFLDRIDKMNNSEWEAYKNTAEYRTELRRKVGAVVEGGLTPTYSTTGGAIANLRQEDGQSSTVIAERANIKGPMLATNVTNSNTIQESLLALAAMCGLRPKDIVSMLKTRMETGKISEAQKEQLTKGVQEAEVKYVPIRQQVKIQKTAGGMYIAVQGTERDMHGPLGRAFGMMLLEGESMQTYKPKMAVEDRRLLAGEITFAEHQRIESELARDLTFVPCKDFGQWLIAKRPQSALAKFLGYTEESPVRSPEEILRGLQVVTPQAFMKALVEEGYYLRQDDSNLVENFVHNSGSSLASNDGMIDKGAKSKVESMDQIIAVSAESVIANKKGFEAWIAQLPGNNAVVVIASSEEYANVREFENVVYIKVVGRDINREYGLKLIELFGAYGKSEFFGGFKLGVPASIDKYKSLAAEISSGV